MVSTKKIGSKIEHDRILQDTLILLGREAYDACRVWENKTGVAYIDRTWGREFIHFGLKGSPDIIGILSNGKFIGIEIKSGSAKQQTNQKNFETMIKKFEGHYIIAHSAREALQEVLRATSTIGVATNV